jgi:hypothetical protein
MGTMAAARSWHIAADGVAEIWYRYICFHSRHYRGWKISIRPFSVSVDSTPVAASPVQALVQASTSRARKIVEEVDPDWHDLYPRIVRPEAIGSPDKPGDDIPSFGAFLPLLQKLHDLPHE